MPDDPFYSPYVKIAPQGPKAGEHVWTLRKGEEEVRAELRSHGEYGWECQLFRNGAFLYGRRWNLYASALLEAVERRHDYERDGWTMTPA